MITSDVIQYEGNSGRDWLVYKYPKTDMKFGSVLIVRNGQEAVFVKDGEIAQTFIAGRHLLVTGNLPFLTKVTKKVFQESIFIAEVYFINKVSKLDMKWGSSNKIEIEDPQHKRLARLKTHGNYSIKLSDTPSFIRCIIGSLPQGTLEGFTMLPDILKGKLDTICISNIKKYILENHIPVVKASMYLVEISEIIREKLYYEFQMYGLHVYDFNLCSIEIETNDGVKKDWEQNVITYHCPNCGASLRSREGRCSHCGSEVIIKDLNSVFAVNEKKLNAYMSEYQSIKGNPEVDKAKGLCFLRLHHYEFAIKSFHKAMEELYEDSDLYFYTALALCKGKRPALLMKKEVDKMLNQLQIALDLQKKGAYYYAYAIVIRDFYERNSLNYKQTSRECEKMAETYGLSQDDKNIIHQFLPIPEHQY